MQVDFGLCVGGLGRSKESGASVGRHFGLCVVGLGGLGGMERRWVVMLDNRAILAFA